MYIEVILETSFYWWRLKGGNHQILATSEGYGRARDARRAARTVAKGLNLKLVDRTK